MHEDEFGNRRLVPSSHGFCHRTIMPAIALREEEALSRLFGTGPVSWWAIVDGFVTHLLAVA